MYTDSVRKANLEYMCVNSRAQHTRVWVNSRVRHTRVCANSRVKHTRVHASACTLASVERASRVWDVASGRYRIYSPRIALVLSKGLRFTLIPQFSFVTASDEACYVIFPICLHHCIPYLMYFKFMYSFYNSVLYT